MEATISMKEASELLGMDVLTLRLALQQGMFSEFGICIRLPGRQRLLYKIFRQKLYQYLGITDDEGN